MEIADFLSISVVGVGLSLLIGFLKAKFGTETTKTKALTLLLSVLVGGLYFFIRDTVWYKTILGVLASASTFYAFFLKK